MGVRSSYVWGLVLLRLGVSFLTFGGYIFTFGGLVILTFGVGFLRLVVRNFYVWWLVFLRLGVNFLTFKVPITEFFFIFSYESKRHPKNFSEKIFRFALDTNF